MTPRDLNGARTLVLGGSGDLGTLIAQRLLDRGGKVMLAARNRSRLHKAATALEPPVPSVEFDLQEPRHVEHVIGTAIAGLGGLDGVVNAAGVVAFGPLADLSDSALDELVATDLVGPLRVIRAAIPHVEGGFVVNISGVVAERPTAGMAAYSAVKAGLSAATVALGRELRRQRITVLDARPPHTETGLVQRSIAGVAPTMPPGLDPGLVAGVIVDGIERGARELPPEAFAAS
ncbi:MAG: SDR family oxidoreductase [Acidimicrobiia bacterium]